MKNIHILPTDKSSRLFIYNRKLSLSKEFQYSIDTIQNQNIYITSDEEIKEGDWFIYRCYKIYKCTGLSQSKQILTDNEIAKHKYYGKPQGLSKKIILTTDQELIKDGVQAIPDEFLEWFVKNPSCDRVDVDLLKKGIYDEYKYLIIIPKEEPKQDKIVERFIANAKQQETIEEASKNPINYTKETNGYPKIQAFKDGAKWKQERMYSDEDVKIMYRSLWVGNSFDFDTSYEMESNFEHDFNLWFEQFKKK